MTTITQTYDDAIYKLVPLEPDENMIVAALQYDTPSVQMDANEHVSRATDYRLMLAAVPTDLPGVVTNDPAEVEQLRQRVKELEAQRTDADVWAEVHRLRGEIKGPDGYATWQDAAVFERVNRVNLEAQLAAQPKPIPWYTIDDAFKRYLNGGDFYGRDRAFFKGGFNAGRAELPLQPTPEAIVKAALEAAANESNRMMMYPGARQESFAHHGVDAAAVAIRALDPAAIIQAAKEPCPECGYGDTRTIADAAVAADRAQQSVKEKLYDELIYAVGIKWANETRHQTALKYIRRAESEYNDIASQQKGDE